MAKEGGRGHEGWAVMGSDGQWGFQEWSENGKDDDEWRVYETRREHGLEVSGTRGGVQLDGSCYHKGKTNGAGTPYRECD